jgi:hypothetical protein
MSKNSCEEKWVMLSKTVANGNLNNIILSEM